MLKQASQKCFIPLHGNYFTALGTGVLFWSNDSLSFSISVDSSHSSRVSCRDRRAALDRLLVAVLTRRSRPRRSSRRQALNAGHDPRVALFPNHVLVSVLLGHVVQLESKDPGHIAVCALGGNQLWVDLEEHVWETAAVVGAVDRGVAGRFGVVDVLAAAAEQLHRLGVRDVGQGNWEKWVVVAQNAGAAAEITLLEFFQLRRHEKSAETLDVVSEIVA